MREVEAESRDLKAQRLREEQHVVLVTPYYEVMRQKIEGSDDEAVEDEAQGKDYLAAYMPLLLVRRGLARRSLHFSASVVPFVSECRVSRREAGGILAAHPRALLH